MASWASATAIAAVICSSLATVSGIIDPYEHGLRRNVLAALDGYFLDPSVDARGYIEPCCIDLTLYEQWFRSQEIEDG